MLLRLSYLARVGGSGRGRRRRRGSSSSSSSIFVGGRRSAVGVACSRPFFGGKKAVALSLLTRLRIFFGGSEVASVQVCAFRNATTWNRKFLVHGHGLFFSESSDERTEAKLILAGRYS